MRLKGDLHVMVRSAVRVICPLAVLVLTAGLVLGGYGSDTAHPAPAVTPVPGGTLTIAFVALATHIDVNSVNISTQNELAHYVYETLFDRDAQGRVRPLLVKEEQRSVDGLTVTWKLQPGVKFHDGSAFNAAAVKWNLERKISKRQPLWDLVPIQAVEAVDDLTVKVTLTRPVPNMRATLSAKTFSMYSPTFAQRVGDDGLKQQASGTGPFALVEFRPNDVLRFRKNPNYWQKGLPYLDEVVFRIVPDVNTRGTMLAAGDADMALALSIPDLQRFKTTRGIKVLEGLGSQQYYVTINNRKPPLDDVRIRKALNHAVDKDGIIRTVLLGAATPATAVYINRTVDGYIRAGTYPYNPETAGRLLDEAGWRRAAGGMRERDGRPLRMELFTLKGAFAGDFEIAELVQGMLRAVGIDTRLNVLEAATFIPRVTRPPDQADYDLVNLNVGTFTGDAEYTMLTFYHSSSAAPRYYNRAYYSNAQVDRLIEGSLKSKTLAGRDKIYYGQVIKQVFDDAPVIMLVDLIQRVAVKETVHGIYLEPASNNWPAKYAWKSAR